MTPLFMPLDSYTYIDDITWCCGSFIVMGGPPQLALMPLWLNL